jgi:hypothetical protein
MNLLLQHHALSKISRHTSPNARPHIRWPCWALPHAGLAEACRETALLDEQRILGFLSRQKPHRGRTWWDVVDTATSKLNELLAMDGALAVALALQEARR